MQTHHALTVETEPLSAPSLLGSLSHGLVHRDRAGASLVDAAAPEIIGRIAKEHLAPPAEGILEGVSTVLTVPGCAVELISVVPHDVARAWRTNNLDAVVLAANRKVPGAPFDPEDLRKACEFAKHQLWLAVDAGHFLGMAVTGIFMEPNRRKVLLWLLVTGRSFQRWRWCRDHIEHWAKGQGCKAARTYARAGWRRTGLTDYTAKGVIMEKALLDG